VQISKRDELFRVGVKQGFTRNNEISPEDNERQQWHTIHIQYCSNKNNVDTDCSTAMEEIDDTTKRY
jgi:hypothetical protein